MKILFKYATRSRRDNFLRGIDSIRKNISDNENYHILITVDRDDNKMFPLPVLDCNHTYIVGDSESKVHAINRDMERAPDWDILVCMSDDMVFTVKGFDDVIRENMKTEFTPDEWRIDEETRDSHYTDVDLFLHFPDGNRSDLCTMSIIGRDYYKRDGYIYNPEYKSLYCDDEAQQVAKLRGCYQFVDQQIFEHLHPAYGKAKFDEQYQRTEHIGNTEDRLIFERRKAVNFGL